MTKLAVPHVAVEVERQVYQGKSVWDNVGRIMASRKQATSIVIRGELAWQRETANEDKDKEQLPGRALTFTRFHGRRQVARRLPSAHSTPSSRTV